MQFANGPRSLGNQHSPAIAPIPNQKGMGELQVDEHSAQLLQSEVYEAVQAALSMRRENAMRLIQTGQSTEEYFNRCLRTKLTPLAQRWEIGIEDLVQLARVFLEP